MRAAILGLFLALISTLTLGGAVIAKPVPNVFDHKDWIGVCDNTLRCTVMALAPDEGDNRAYLSITRDGDPTATPTLKVALYSDTNIASGPVHLRAPGFDVDVAGRWDDDSIVGASRDQTLIASLVHLASGEAKAVQVSIGKTSVSLSLSGAAAALVWMDDRQGRLGSVTALTRKGPKLASALPSAPGLPVYMPAPKGSAIELKPVVFPKAMLMRPELKDCEKEQLSEVDERAAWRLGPDLVLWSVPCILGAYNLDSLFFLSDAHGGAIRPAPIPVIATPQSNEPGANPPYSLINADFDPKTMVLNAFEKGRGIGDCGDLARFLWDGRTFQPLEYDYMPECRGVTPEAWPTLYRGRMK